jgi:hypothetical protein
VSVGGCLLELCLCDSFCLRVPVAFLTPDPVTDRNLLRDLIRTINPRAVYVAGMPLELGVRAMALELGLLVPAVFVIEDACW